MPVLYHYPMAPSSRFIRLVLGEYKCDFELRVKNPWERDEALLRLNPAGEVPVLDDAAKGVYCGARVISEWLEDTLEGAKLLQGSAEQKAEIRRLIDWFDGKFSKEVSNPLFSERVKKRFLKGQPVSSDIIRTAVANSHVHFGYFEWLLGQHGWLAGDNISLADFMAAAHISVLDYFGDVNWEKYPDVKSWYMKMKSRPSFRPLLADRLVGMPPAKDYAELDF
ncbi:MAG: glutathione S-transferase family protein [Candidatus Puniceispirillaceae bacterium]